LPAAMLANIQIVLYSFFVAGMFEFYHRYSVLNAGVLKDENKQGVYCFNCYLFPKKREYKLIISGLYCNGFKAGLHLMYYLKYMRKMLS
jgi:hypothetical protein